MISVRGEAVDSVPGEDSCRRRVMNCGRAGLCTRRVWYPAWIPPRGMAGRQGSSHAARLIPMTAKSVSSRVRSSSAWGIRRLLVNRERRSSAVLASRALSQAVQGDLRVHHASPPRTVCMASGSCRRPALAEG